MSVKTYLTTTLPYVNADPHIGFAAELVHADIIARYFLLTGREVFSNTGTDEHGLKIYRAAQVAGISPQDYVDKYALEFKKLLPALGLWEGTNFIRTTDPYHVGAAQEFWRLCVKAGDIYKKTYRVKYCVGCELEKTESELVNNLCPLHPNLALEFIEEENYFFKFSKYQRPLLELYEKNPNFVLPVSRQNEIRAFVERGLEDFSISRLAKKMPWGVPVPDDPDQVMYVWFDALVNYLSAIGWPTDEKKFKHWWPVTQFAGKDNLRQQAAMWQAMLMSAGLPPSKQIIIRGFVTGVGGQKMSKSLGNVINPHEVVEEYGTDAIRYYLARHVTPFEDSPVTLELIKEAYNAHLANGLGNLVSRVMKMAEKYLDKPVVTNDDSFKIRGEAEKYKPFFDHLSQFEINKSMDFIWDEIKNLDLYIQTRKPFELWKTTPDAARNDVISLVGNIAGLAHCLAVVMPETAKKIQELIKENKMPEAPLFMRK